MPIDGLVLASAAVVVISAVVIARAWRRGHTMSIDEPVLVSIVSYNFTGFGTEACRTNYLFKVVGAPITFWLRNRADVLDTNAKYWFTKPDKLELAT